MSYHSRRILTPAASRKRKERDVFYAATLPKPVPPPTDVKRAVNSATTSSNSKGSQPQQAPPLSSNQLLAGYMAYEFMTRGTLFGQKFDRARAEAGPVSSAELKRNNRQSLSQIQSPGSTEAVADEPSGKSTPHRYAEVAHILKSDGAHIPGVVNPTQLTTWIQM